MKSYFGYDKPYLYVYCPAESTEVMEQTLIPLTEQGVLFCRGGQVSKKELRRVEAAHAVMLFVTKACKADMPYALSLGDKLVREGVRVFLDVCETKDSQSAEQTADALQNCDRAIFLLSEKACESLEMRNAVNYALAIKKDLLCLKTDSTPLSHGLDMQLANVTMLPYDDNTVMDALRTRECLTQSVIGEGMEHKNVNRKKQLVFAGIAAVIVALLAVGGVFAKQRIDYYRSAEYVFRNADDSEYINIASYGADGITALAGKSVKELDLTDGGFTDLTGIGKIGVETLNLTGNPALTDLHEVFYCQGLRRLVVSQDMLDAVSSYPHNELQIVVAK